MDGTEPRSGRLHASPGRSLARGRSVVRSDRRDVGEGVAGVRIRREYVLRPQSGHCTGASVSSGADARRPRSARRANVAVLMMRRFGDLLLGIGLVVGIGAIIGY